MIRASLLCCLALVACQDGHTPGFGGGGSKPEYEHFDTGLQDTGTVTDGESPLITGIDVTVEDWGGAYDWVIYARVGFDDPQGSENLMGGKVYLTVTQDGEVQEINAGEPLAINNGQAVLDDGEVSFAVSNINITSTYTIAVQLEDADGNDSNEYSVEDISKANNGQ